MASDHEKYIHTLSKVESRQAQEVKDIVINPPNKKYEALKKAIYTAIDRLAIYTAIDRLAETQNTSTSRDGRDGRQKTSQFL